MSEEQNDSRLDEANGIIKKHLVWSAGAGVLPLPIVDSLLVSGVQLKMLKNLADHYDLPFNKEIVKSLIASLLGGLSANVLAFGSVGQMAKAIPGIGTLFGMVAMPITGVATTYAVGKIFIKHFEQGGTFFDFDLQSARGHFQKEFTKGAKVQEGEVQEGEVQEGEVQEGEVQEQAATQEQMSA